MIAGVLSSSVAMGRTWAPVLLDPSHLPTIRALGLELEQPAQIRLRSDQKDRGGVAAAPKPLISHV
jgi:hypothetical protein